MFYTTMKAGSVLRIGDDIEVRVSVRGRKPNQYARVAIQAPRDIPVLREYLHPRTDKKPGRS